MAKIVGVKFKEGGKVYYFAPSDPEYKRNETVIVETAKGVEYGTVSIPVTEVPDNEVVTPLKPVIRKATKKDLDTIARNEQRRPEAMRIAQEKVEKHKLDLKLLSCEFTFDGSKVVFYFTADGRVDFRELVKDLASAFHIRIELRQIGIRDETKLLGGLGPCGRPCCCASCMPELKKVSIKMAKTQGLSLNPTKISGLCGRLMCCLGYENYYYAEVYKKMPKLGSEVKTPDGNGVAVSNNMLKQEVRVRIESKDGSQVYRDFPLADIRFQRGGRPEPDDDHDPNLKGILD